MNTAEKVTVEDYLAYLESIEGRAEFYDGVIYEMGGFARASVDCLRGSSDEHALIGGNFLTALNNALGDRPCRVYGADSNLAIDELKTVVMPDVHVVCGENEPSNQNPKLHTNPLLVVEVLSESTESYDRKKKFDKYKLLQSLQEYVLVAQDEPRIEVFSLNEQGIWEYNAYLGLEEIVKLHSIQASVTMAAIYRRVVFSETVE